MLASEPRARAAGRKWNRNIRWRVLMTTKLTERIDALESRLLTLKNRQRQIDARRATVLARRERKEDTRRKILAGAILLAKVESGEMDVERFRLWIAEAVTRPEDRALFDP